jgi:hypothetical protein
MPDCADLAHFRRARLPGVKSSKNLLFLKKKKQKDFSPGAAPAALPKR